MQNKPISRGMLLNITIIVEALILLAASLWIYFTGLPIGKSLIFEMKPILLGIIVGIIMAFTGLGAYAIGKVMPGFSQLRELIQTYLLPMVSELNPLDLIVLSVLSGFCEEVFFRGVVQPQFGLPITAIAFGLFHDPSFRHIAYSLSALIYGVVLGLLFQFTGNLWAPIFAHMTHNLISLYILRYRLKPPATPIKTPPA